MLDREIDTVGNTNPAEAAAKAGVGRFVLTSIPVV